MNKPVAWINRDEYHGWLNWDKNTEMPINIPLYTQEQLEEARKLGMQQERALWNLAESTQEFESFDRTASHMAGEYVAHPVKELTDDVAKYHYNKGHEDGRKLVTVKELTDELEKTNDGLWEELKKYIDSKPISLKELTDEEIHECWEMFMGTDDYTRIDIAKAILKKAQEK